MNPIISYTIAIKTAFGGHLRMNNAFLTSREKFLMKEKYFWAQQKVKQMSINIINK